MFYVKIGAIVEKESGASELKSALPARQVQSEIPNVQLADREKHKRFVHNLFTLVG
jgi:hypothetical protein